MRMDIGHEMIYEQISYASHFDFCFREFVDPKLYFFMNRKQPAVVLGSHAMWSWLRFIRVSTNQDEMLVFSYLQLDVVP